MKVVAASGVRAGSLTNTGGNEPVTTARKPFATVDAYADPGYWYFFYENEKPRPVNSDYERAALRNGNISWLANALTLKVLESEFHERVMYI